MVGIGNTCVGYKVVPIAEQFFHNFVVAFGVFRIGLCRTANHHQIGVDFQVGELDANHNLCAEHIPLNLAFSFPCARHFSFLDFVYRQLVFAYGDSFSFKFIGFSCCRLLVFQFHHVRTLEIFLGEKLYQRIIYYIKRVGIKFHRIAVGADGFDS